MTFKTRNIKNSIDVSRLSKKNPVNLSIALTLCSAMLTLTGCDDANVEQLTKVEQWLNKALNKVDTVPSRQFCQSSFTPFNHSVCEISQTSLTKSNSPYALKLFWKSGKWQDKSVQADTNQSLTPLYTFDAVLHDLEPHAELIFAANAGMYNDSFAPIGYTVINGEEVLSLNLNNGSGNFHLMPNGVLWWDKSGKVRITESEKLSTMLKKKRATPLYATQSGPMLVIDGKIHPKFNSDSLSLKVRNGVGVCDDGHIKFVNSHERVNFYQFATYFKDDLGCPNALFLDGGVASALYAPDINRKENKEMGVIVGLVKDNTAKN